MARIIEIHLDDETELKLSAAADEMNQTIESLIERNAGELARDLFTPTNKPKTSSLSPVQIVGGNITFTRSKHVPSSRYGVYMQSADKFTIIDNSQNPLSTPEKALTFRDDCRFDFPNLEFEACEILVGIINHKNPIDGCTPPKATIERGAATAANQPPPTVTHKRPNFDRMSNNIKEAQELISLLNSSPKNQAATA